ncbi:MAG: MlaD family protein [Gammaproteobacteria bacterium]|nr:MlaD family protein [Gammaproteobacteria bacterium]
MERHANYTTVGIFVITLTSMIIIGIIWLSAGFSSGSYSIYQVNMIESVSGLSIDAPVEYNGVNVGSVNYIGINHKNPRLVKLLLKIKSDTPITRGTRAQLNIRSLSGIAYMALEDDESDLTPLTVETGKPYPIIPTKPSFFLRLETAVTQFNDNFNQISQSIHDLLNDENLKNFQSLLQSTQSSMYVIQTESLPEINQAMTNLNMITRNLADISLEMKQNPAILIRGKEPQALGPGEK